MSLTVAHAPGRDERSGWPVRLLPRYARSPLWLGLGTLLLYAGCAWLWHLATGSHADPRSWVAVGIGADPLYALSIAWAPVTLLYFRRGAVRDVEALAPLVGRDSAALRRILFAPSPRALHAAFAFALFFFVLDMGVGLLLQEIPYRPGLKAWWAVREAIADLTVFLVLAWMVAIAMRLSALAPEPERIRLLATEPLALFAHHGARLALFSLLIWAIWLPALWMMQEPAVAFAIVPLGAGVAFSAACLWLPTRGVRSAIRTAKQAELERVRRAIESAREAALATTPAAPQAEASSQLPGLLAYEQRVLDVSVSSIDARALRRVGLYLLIPLGSWIGGALVERIVDAALGP